MLKVGDFSRLANVTVKTLRHYDELGLLHPVWTDRYSSYRYYNLDQLPRLNRILALKDLGFSLAQIRRMLDGELPAEELRRMFNQKQAELALRVRSEQDRLARVAERLQQIELEGRLPLAGVMLKTTPAQWVAGSRLSAASLADLAARSSRARAELNAWAAANGLRARGPWLTIYHQQEYRERQLDVEVALVIEPSARLEALRLTAAISLRQLPALESSACLIQPAGERKLQETFTTLLTWCERNRYLMNGSLRELLLEDPAQQKPPAQFIEAQLPVQSIQALKHSLLLNPYRKEEDMEPKFVDLPAFDVVGVRYFGKNENNEIPQTWDVFNKRCSEIQHVSPNSPAYGICQYVPDAGNTEFEYVCSFAVDSTADVPQDMVSRSLAPQRYAVFVHVGPLDGLHDTYNYIYQVWLPQSGLALAGTPDFELYNEEFKFGAPDSKLYLYVPVK